MGCEVNGRELDPVVAAMIMDEQWNQVVLLTLEGGLKREIGTEGPISRLCREIISALDCSPKRPS